MFTGIGRTNDGRALISVRERESHLDVGSTSSASTSTCKDVGTDFHPCNIESIALLRQVYEFRR